MHNKQRRILLKWSTPVLAAVVLPTHAEMSSILDDPIIDTPREEFIFPEDCTVPYEEPFVPPLPGTNQCKAFGGKATNLNNTAYAKSQGLRGEVDMDAACEAVRNYKFCDFTEDPAKACASLKRSFENTGGVMSTILDCD